MKDAHDRYANVEVAYLLQRMESFDGVAILTTNLRANVDEAFTRRLDAIVDFPMPEEDDRRRLWERNLPPALPRDDDVDLDFLARAFKLSGGNIRNICVTAAFLAAADGRGRRDGATSSGRTEREYRKLGRLTVEAEFGKYLDLVAIVSRPAGPLPDRAEVAGPAPEPLSGAAGAPILGRSTSGGTPMHDFEESGRTHRRTPPPAPEVAAPGAAVASSPAIATNGAALSPAAILGPAADRRQRVGRPAAGRRRGAEASPVHDVVGRGGGSPLDAGVRGEMEGRFGQDFSDVRVHTDKQASDSAEAVGANAYTVGNDVVFRSGQFDASSPTGQRTLAHELTHVVQQRSGPVDGSPAPGGINLSSPSDRFEQAADKNADAVMSGAPVRGGARRDRPADGPARGRGRARGRGSRDLTLLAPGLWPRSRQGTAKPVRSPSETASTSI